MRIKKIHQYSPVTNIRHLTPVVLLAKYQVYGSSEQKEEHGVQNNVISEEVGPE